MRVTIAVLALTGLVATAASVSVTPTGKSSRPPTQGIVPFNPGADMLGIGPRIVEQQARAARCGEAAEPGLMDVEFTKLSHAGDELPPDAATGPGADDWGCTRDNTTGLVWALDTVVASWRDAAGAVTDQANLDMWCGLDRWRLPTIVELQGITSFTTDTGYFPAVPAWHFWSAVEDAGDPGQARAVHAGTGEATSHTKRQTHRARLVHTVKCPG